MSRHVLNTRLHGHERRLGKKTCRVGVATLESSLSGRRFRHSARVDFGVVDGSTSATCLSEAQPLPPSDRLTQEQLQQDVERLYRQRAPALIHHFTGSWRDRDAAMEVVQEAFARFSAISGAKRLSIDRPESYLFRICQNLFRERQRQIRSGARPELHERQVDPCHDQVAHLEDRDRLRRLEAAIGRLRPKTREIFLARRVDGMSYAQIADRTGLTVKGVEKQMTKAIVAINRMMGRV